MALAMRLNDVSASVCLNILPLISPSQFDSISSPRRHKGHVSISGQPRMVHCNIHQVHLTLGHNRVCKYICEVIPKVLRLHQLLLLQFQCKGWLIENRAVRLRDLYIILEEVWCTIWGGVYCGHENLFATLSIDSTNPREITSSNVYSHRLVM